MAGGQFEPVAPQSDPASQQTDLVTSLSSADQPEGIRPPIDWGRRGLVFDIRRFSTHDGPGIRTTVFTKGCPLRCLWCQNPEGIHLKQRLFYFKDKCLGCGTCIDACPVRAISPSDGKIVIDRTICNLCGECVKVCPPLALSLDSREMTVREVVDEVLQDRKFYRESGGMTISGGDPTYQADFNTEVLRACRAEGIHTAIETSLYTAPDVLDRFLPHLSLLIADFKVADQAHHEAWTGVSNDRIKANFEKVLAMRRSGQAGFDLLVRIPLIPGHTASLENLRAIGDFFLQKGPDVRIELLNYNPLAQNKYTLLDQPYLFDRNPRMFTGPQMDEMVEILGSLGLNAFRE